MPKRRAPRRCTRCKINAQDAVVHVSLVWAGETWEYDLCRSHAITLRRMLDGWAGRPFDTSTVRQLSLRVADVPPSKVAPLTPRQRLQEDVEDRA